MNFAADTGIRANSDISLDFRIGANGHCSINIHVRGNHDRWINAGITESVTV